MAGILIGAQTGDITVTAATSRTLLQVVAAANHRVVIHWFKVCFKGTTATDAPIKLQVLIQTNAGTMSSLTVNAIDPTINETIQTSAQHSSTADPTDSTIFDAVFCHPQRSITLPGPFVIPGGTRLAVKMVSPGQNNTCVASFRGEE